MRSALVPILLADPLPWAQKAEYAWDFLRDRARFGGGYRGLLANTPGWTFTRASTGYYTTTGGVLVPFASGSLRTGDRGALIEGAGTNLCLQSQTFDNASWNNFHSVETAAATASPTSAVDAFRLVDDSGTGTGTVSIFQNVTVPSATNMTFSVFCKADQLSWIALRTSNYDATGNGTSYFNIGSGVVGTKDANHSASGIQALSNGWYRVWIVFQTTTDVVGTINILIAEADGDSVVSRNGTSSIYIWGAQLEATAYATSYIPTTTASATRAADSLTVTGVTGLDYPLTLYAEFERASDRGADSGVFEVNSGSSNDRALLNVSSSDLMQVYARTSSVDQVNATIAGALAIGTVYKTAARISTNDSRHALGGTLGTQDTSCTNPATPSKIVFGNQNSETLPIYGYLRRAALFTRALTNAELQAITA